MKGYHTKIFALVFAVLGLNINGFGGVAHNEANTEVEVGDLHIYADYETGIVPQENDIFVIEYKVQGGEATAKITVDANTAAANYVNVSLPRANYEVVGVKYKGSNDDIANGSYGTERYFSIAYNDAEILHIKIGKKKTTVLESETEAFIVDDDHLKGDGTRKEDVRTFNPLPLDDATQTDAFDNLTTATTTERIKAPLGDNDFESEYDENLGAEEQQAVSEEPQVEYYEQDQKQEAQKVENRKNITSKLVYLLVIGVVGVAIIFFLKKAGKV